LGDRLGAAFAEGAPTGVSLDIARATSTSAQAQQAASFPGAAFGLTQAPTGAAAWQAMQARAPQGVTARQQSLRQGLAGALQVSRVRSSSMWDATKANEAGNAISRALHSALTKEIAGVSAVEVLHSSVA